MQQLPINQILNGDALQHLKELPDQSIDMCMTSPPYWSLRDYGNETETIWDGDENCEHDFEIEIIKNPMDRGGKGQHDKGGMVGKMGDKTQTKVRQGFCKKYGAWKGQLGLEPTFDLYIKHLCDIFDEVKRVLKKTGTLWVNLGDTYSSGNRGEQRPDPMNKKGRTDTYIPPNRLNCGVPDKCLTLIPFRFAIEMVNRGWILRNTIIWHKRNCMPSSVKDRFTVDFEYLFFFSKNKKYYFEQQFEPLAEVSLKDRRKDKGRFEYNGKRKGVKGIQNAMCGISSKGRNKRCVWTINPKPFKDAHFAVYPHELCETPIRAGCPKYVCVKCGNPKVLEIERDGMSSAKLMKGKDKSHFQLEQGKKENIRAPREAFERKIIKKGYKPTCSCNAEFESGIVLDPFFGSGTTGLVALKQGKRFVGIELNPKYIRIAKKRLKPFLEQAKLK